MLFEIPCFVFEIYRRKDIVDYRNNVFSMSAIASDSTPSKMLHHVEVHRAEANFEALSPYIVSKSGLHLSGSGK